MTTTRRTSIPVVLEARADDLILWTAHGDLFVWIRRDSDEFLAAGWTDLVGNETVYGDAIDSDDTPDEILAEVVHWIDWECLCEPQWLGTSFMLESNYGPCKCGRRFDGTDEDED